MLPGESDDTSSAVWQELYVRLEKPLFNLAYRYTWNRDEAQDVVHDAFLALWDRRRLLRSATVDRYLWVSVLNLARKRRRWRKLKVFLQIDAESWLEPLVDLRLPEGAVASAQLHAQLAQAIDSLPEKLRAALLLAEFSSLSYEAAARMLAIPAGTFASRRNLAIKRLQHSMVEADGRRGR